MKKIKKPFNPWIYPAFFALTALLAVFAGLPEKAAAAAACVFFAAVTFIHPLNGIYFILLAAPFFLSDSKRPFYLLMEFFAYTIILSGGIHYLVRKPEIKLNRISLPVAVFAAVSIMAFPLEIKEIIWDLRVWHPVETLRSICSSHEGSSMYFFRALFNTLSGILIFFTAGAFTADEKDISRVFKPVLLMLLANAVFAYLLRYSLLPAGGSYLSLSLVGRHGPGATAFAYNRAYLNKYLSMFFPFACFFLLERTRPRILPAASGITLLGVFAVMALTYQRTTALVTGGQLILLAALLLKISVNPKRDLVILLSCFACAAGIFYISDYYLLSGMASGRISSGVTGVLSGNIGPREALWRVSIEMFKRNPLLGVGNGRFLPAFADYCEHAGVSFERVQFFRTNAHNVFLHTLAEKGFAGLVAFILVLAGAFNCIFRSIKHLAPGKQKVLIILSMSLAGWLLYGLTEHTFYIRSLQLFFWIVLSFTCVILRGRLPGLNLRRKTKIAILLAVAALMSVRTYQAVKHPYPENFYSGFHRAEMQPEGRTARWTGRRAVRRFPAGQGNLVIGLKCPTPAVAQRPQEVTITVNGHEEAAVISGTEYKEVEIPAAKITEDFVWLRIESSYVLNPAREGWSGDDRYLGIMVYEPLWKGLKEGHQR